MNRALIAAALALAVTGCLLGSSAGGFRPANERYGTDVQVDNAIDGELLTVADSAVLVKRQDGKLMLVRFGHFDVLDVRTAGGMEHALRVLWHPTPGQLDRWRLVARYPQGLAPAQLDALLRVAGQSQLEVQ